MSPPKLEDLVTHFWNSHEDSEWTQKTDVIPGDQLREWMRSDDIEVLGFLFAMIDDARFHIEPPIDVREYCDFVKRYSARCFRENPDGEWADNRYSAGWNIVGVFCVLWDKQVPRDVLTDLKIWLADLYREGNQDLRTCLETASLEHMFERQAIREFFLDWKNDPLLNQAYESALLWVTHGGKSTLSKSRKNQ
jgi:hypothetical protein